ncbi:MAG: mevalonate kinase [Patescibacteria group bacterium]|nr:MAG: mevalonate kinase [Patescibacteria group bacterium]
MNQTSIGKFILTGEHSVVYGEPALVAGLDKHITVELLEGDNQEISEYTAYIFALFEKRYGVDTTKLSVRAVSEIPQNSGLGSSAAFAHAVIKALVNYFSKTISKDEMFDLVYQSEVFIHKKPSGIDPCAVVYGGVHLFQKDLQQKTFFKQKIQFPHSYKFLLVNSGKATESTGEMVTFVSDTLKKNPAVLDTIKSIGKISREIQTQLVSESFTGELLDKNEQELEKLGVVGKHAQKIIHELTKIGAHAKITGAGGVQTGSGWILAWSEDLNRVEQFCIQNGWEYFVTEVQ